MNVCKNVESIGEKTIGKFFFQQPRRPVVLIAKGGSNVAFDLGLGRPSTKSNAYWFYWRRCDGDSSSSYCSKVKASRKVKSILREFKSFLRVNASWNSSRPQRLRAL